MALSFPSSGPSHPRALSSRCPPECQGVLRRGVEVGEDLVEPALGGDPAGLVAEDVEPVCEHAVAHELKRDGIGVSVLCPGPTPSRIGETARTTTEPGQAAFEDTGQLAAGPPSSPAGTA